MLTRVDLTRRRRGQVVLANAADLCRPCLHCKIRSCCRLLCRSCCDSYGIPERIRPRTVCNIYGNIGAQKRSYNVIVAVALQQTQHPRLVTQKSIELWIRERPTAKYRTRIRDVANHVKTLVCLQSCPYRVYRDSSKTARSSDSDQTGLARTKRH